MPMRKKLEEKLLDVDASMQGTLSFKDSVNLRINGKFEGTLEVRGTLTIGPTAIIKADIVGDNIVVGGRVNGKIIAKESLTLLPTGVLIGEIYPAKLNVSEGAVLDGRCSMLNDYLTAEELARYLEVDLDSIIEWADSGKVPATREGDIWKFDRKNIDAWISSGKLK